MPNQTYNADLEKLHSLLDQEDTNATLEYLSDITKTRRNEWRVWAIAAKAYQKLEFWEHSEDAYSKVISMVGGRRIPSPVRASTTVSWKDFRFCSNF